MREIFKEKRFGRDALDTIAKANAIITDYKQQGFTLTLRQLYYQFVSAALIKNDMKAYKNLGAIINSARLAGLIDWNAIEDRTRNLVKYGYDYDVKSSLEYAADSYQLDHWDAQPCYVEVWVEKEALIGVISEICRKLHVPYFACRGYVSQSEQYDAGKRFELKIDRGQEVHILHLGDHDPSGIDMTRDNQTRLTMFAGQEINLKRLALNMDQIDQYAPPPNPAKITDSRATGYIAKFGHESWELDALKPQVISNLIKREIDQLIDEDSWQTVDDKQKADRAKIRKFVDAVEEEEE